MKTSEFLAQLKRLNVRVWSEAGELRCKAPKGVLTEELRADLAARKTEILAVLEAARVSSQDRSRGADAVIPRAPEGQRPLSFTQQRLWFLHLLEPELTAYNIPMSWTLTGELDAGALERALAEIVRRHEVLRSVFPSVEGKPHQILLDPGAITLDHLEAPAGRSEEDWRAEIQRLLQAKAREPFDLSRGPLLRPTLVRVGPREHVLFVLVHHIAFDGGSIDHLLRELRTLYDAFCEGRPSPLADPAIQYSDYAHWQGASFQGAEFERQLDYWREQLKGELPVLELPYDRPRPPVQGYHGARVGRPFRKGLIEELGELAQREGATLFMLLLAAYKALLQRTTALGEIVVASPIAGRDRAELQELIGYFANTLVLRTDLSGDPTFRELLGRVREVCLGAYEHQDMPFEKLVDELSPERSLSYTPLFQTIFLMEDAVGENARMRGIEIEPYALETFVARTDVMFYPFHSAEGWSAWAEYNTDLFDRATMERFLEHYRVLLEDLVARPDARLSELSILGPAERKLVLEDWNTTTAPYPELPIHAQLEAQTGRTPDATAVIFPAGEGRAEVELSYRELDRRANLLAQHLIAAGVAPGGLVGVCLERSAELPVSLLGILKTGSAYVPLDPTYPPDRIAYMAEDAGLEVVVTTSDLSHLLPSGPKHVCIDAERDAIAARPDARPGASVGIDDRMYVIYTSGSTGRPKGVELEHRSASNMFASIGKQPGFSAGERFLAVTTPSFDISVYELFGPLLVGGTVIVAPQEAVSAGDRMQALLERYRPAVLQATPALWRMLILSGWAGDPNLRIHCTGEAFPRDLAQELVPRGKEVWNMYGPTEATIWAAIERVESGETPILIGRPVASTRIYILDAHMQPLPIGVPGELYIGGACLARGYLGRPDLTRERFLPDPFVPGERIYRSGDLARFLPNGDIECLGRIDNQVKLRGFRIELGEIETQVAEVEGVEQCVCVVREDRPGDQRLTAYFVGDAPEEALRARAKERLPAYMVPAAFSQLDALPLTPNGKVDRRALLQLEHEVTDAGAERVEAEGDLERRIAEIWSEVLGVHPISVATNFFDLGGHSLLLAQVHAKLRETFPALSIVELFQYPTVRSLAAHFSGEGTGVSASGEPRRKRGLSVSGDIAIVGMAGRFPGARDVAQFWSNLRAGVESIRRFSEEELLEAGIDPALIEDPDYVKAHGHLDDIDLFDADFFEISPREAEITDPQRRFFLECVWEALEDASLDPERTPGAIGLFAGTSNNAYVLDNLIKNPEAIRSVGGTLTALGNHADFLATHASYRLDLRGPSLTVQTACSTSLVATHLACRSLLEGESDVALAGGVCINVLRKQGYLFVEGGTASSDGHVRAFDARGDGMLNGNGVAVVVLKRLEDAIADGDAIRAVIKGTAINNDGVHKVSFTAPSVDGQAQVIDDALEGSGVDPATITLVEAHGTGTPLGDPIEIAALTQAWRKRTDVRGTCAIGSVKSNLGHLDIAAGATGLIKAALSLEHREIPPSLNYETPNPAIDFDASPFFVNTALRAWESPAPRRAAVSSFGMGGTNAHAILEQAPERGPSSASRACQVLLVSARSEAALEAATARLAEHLEAHPDLSLADVAYTTQIGRKAFERRRSVVCRDVADGTLALRKLDKLRVTTGQASAGRAVAFLFTGQGAQYPNMARGIYESEAVFREELDRCCEILKAHMGRDLRELLLPAESATEAAAQELEQTQNTQPALFVIEYALARQLEFWGIAPQAMVGHSIGEYVAACLAGVFSLEDALRLVAARGRLIGSLPPGGAMLSVQLSEEEFALRLSDVFSIAAINAPGLCVVSGPAPEIDLLAMQLEREEVGHRKLHTSHAFHSYLMDPILAAFAAELSAVELKAPEQRFISCSTGTWIRAEEATDPEYWVRHIRYPVRFADCVQTLVADSDALMLELGPGQTLASLARMSAPEAAIVSTIRHPREEADDLAVLSGALGELWTAGVTVDWRAFHAGERRLRVPLPTYPFQRQRYWIGPAEGSAVLPEGPVRRSADLADWFFVPSWRPSAPPVATAEDARTRWLIFADAAGVTERLLPRLTRAGDESILVRPGVGFARDEDTYSIDPSLPESYAKLIEDLRTKGELPDRIVHLWGVEEKAEAAQEHGFYSLLFLAQALGARPEGGLPILVVTTGMQSVGGGPLEYPEKATVLGVCRSIQSEIEGLTCRSIDLEVDAPDAILVRLARELRSDAKEGVVAYRGSSRWLPEVERVRIDEVEGQPLLREGGTYLVTGGLGGIGLTLAEHLARGARAKLVLTARSALPARETWDTWLSGHSDDDDTSRKIRHVRRLEELGAEVLTLCADVADRDAMRAALGAARQRFGTLHGVVHAAGVPGAGLIELKTRAAAEAVLAPKLRGTRILNELLADEPLDFLVLCSSMVTAVVSVGQVDYVAANSYLNAFAQHVQVRHGIPAISIGWDAWQEVGMAVNTDVPEGMRQARAESLRTGIAPDDGCEAFRRLLWAGLPHVYVSPRDLPSREDYRPAPETEVAESGAAETPAPTSRTLARPALSTEYAAASSETEEEICTIWGDLLGVDPVGVRDNFFELGGNSLVMMQLNVRLRSKYGVSLPMREIFETPQVAALAEKIESVRATAKPTRREEFTL